MIGNTLQEVYYVLENAVVRSDGGIILQSNVLCVSIQNWLLMFLK